MGMLVNGQWQSDDLRSGAAADFVRPQTVFRNWVTADGSSGFPAVAGRYRLYVSYACPWAHRTLIFRKLKKLDDVIEKHQAELSSVLSQNGVKLYTPPEK